MLWERDLMSWERDKYFFHMSPQCCRTNGIVSSKIYDKRDDFNFEIVNFHMEMFLALPPMVYLFLSLFVLLECVLMLMTSTTETYFQLLSY